MRHIEVWEKIGLNIMYLRKQKKLTQMQLAEKCCGQGDDDHISRNYIQRIETAASSCTVDTLIDIADALEVPLARLFDFKE